MHLENEVISVNAWMALPFCVLLAAIALGPLFFADWWGRNYPKVVAVLAVIVVTYYLATLHAPWHVLRTAHEYISFITLIGALFVVSGGIHINVKGEATPGINVLFLLFGALLANVFGTTGASMLLIRPWLRMNKYRVSAHHVAFFIFIVSNVGGCLTPVGDPPLFLGYLMGVPFWWVMARGFHIWMVGVGILLGLFFAVDYRNYLKAPRSVRAEQTGHSEEWRFDGVENLFFLAIILGAVFVNHPPFLREVLMLGAALGSYFTTKKPVHESNHFSLGPVKEVAILFVGIFATMMPALEWMQGNAAKFSEATAGSFYFGSGALSSVLDNAPTYLCFLNAAFGRYIPSDIVPQVMHLVQSHGAGLASLTGPHAAEVRRTFTALQQFHSAGMTAGSITSDEVQVAFLMGNLNLNTYLLAISFGSVFFGANTYIGNGPNFMVKAIADHQKVHTPSFLGYIGRYTLPFMIPMVLAVWWLYFR
ncbi:MAG TPA: sodium:proton antiporter [Verrucomicrobiae bacterium]|jgi:Na+/H+ antiporter NhaD/arsenite permease-like protein|nr:sodium:proton antiporter [Verrucomicrobiae bacterium]